MRIPEQLLHFIWEHQLFDKKGLKTVSGLDLEVVDPGVLNLDAGPDFSDALIRIGDMVWSGPVEIHVKAAEYFDHQHHMDPAYDNIVLHVVLNANRELAHCETLSLEHRIPSGRFEEFNRIRENKRSLPCEEQITGIDPGLVHVAWHDAGLKRLASRNEDWNKVYTKMGYSYQTLFLAMVARALGTHLNGGAMQRLVQILSTEHRLTKLLANERNVEPILFGVAGLLPALSSVYPVDEYKHWQLINRSAEMQAHQWKFLRTRPWNFPTVRIAELAAVCRAFPGVASAIEDETGSWLKDVRITPYWTDHYHFNKPFSRSRSATLSSNTKQLIRINAIAPFTYLYATRSGDKVLINRVLDLLNRESAELNKYTRIFSGHGIIPSNAVETQGILHLYKEYCSAKKCLNCIIGQEIIRNT